MEFDFLAIASGVITRLEDNSAAWSKNATHLLINPIGNIGLHAVGANLTQLTLIEDGNTPVIIAGKYMVAESSYIVVEQVMSIPSEQPADPKQAAGPEQPAGPDQTSFSGWDIQ